jgi:hypothetical protein
MFDVTLDVIAPIADYSILYVLFFSAAHCDDKAFYACLVFARVGTVCMVSFLQQLG